PIVPPGEYVVKSRIDNRYLLRKSGATALRAMKMAQSATLSNDFIWSVDFLGLRSKAPSSIIRSKKDQTYLTSQLKSNDVTMSVVARSRTDTSAFNQWELICPGTDSLCLMIASKYVKGGQKYFLDFQNGIPRASSERLNLTRLIDTTSTHHLWMLEKIEKED
ncbi:MAG: hypothetical protein AAFO07_30850, partial [Bacteroidota bacterium]